MPGERDIDPYAPPQTEAQETVVEPIDGCVRNGDLLVLTSTSPVLPHCCLLTGEPLSADTYQEMRYLVWVPLFVRLGIPLLVIAQFTVHSQGLDRLFQLLSFVALVNCRLIRTNCFLSETAHRRIRHSRLGLLALATMTAVAVISFTHASWESTVVTVVLASVLISPILTLFPLRAVAARGSDVWVKSAPKPLLDQLPDLKESFLPPV